MIVESLIADREVLYFMKQDGCPACEAGATELSKFMSKHPAVTVLSIDVDGPYPGRLGVKRIPGTPFYLFRRGNEGVTKIGVLKVAELERWLKSLRATI